MTHDGEPRSPVGGSDTGARLYQRWQPPPSDELTPRRMEVRRLGEGIRAVIDRLVSTDAPTERISAAADALEALAAEFAGSGRSSIYEGFAETTLAGGDPHAQFEQSPFIGRANPLAPPITLWQTDDQIEGEVTFGSAYEGPPGHVHGGYVAGAFDEVLGATQTLSGQAGMTGTLTVVYRAPTPLHTPLRFRGWLSGVEGRKIHTEATLHAGDTLCAEARGIFIAIELSKFVELLALRDRQVTGEDATGPGSA